MLLRMLTPALFGLLLLTGWAAPSRAEEAKITVFARIYAAPGHQDEVRAFLLKIREYVMKNAPPTVYDFYQSQKDPTQFFTFEIYPSQAALDDHNKNVLGAAIKAVGPVPDGALAKPVEITQVNGINP